MLFWQVTQNKNRILINKLWIISIYVDFISNMMLLNKEKVQMMLVKYENHVTSRTQSNSLNIYIVPFCRIWTLNLRITGASVLRIFILIYAGTPNTTNRVQWAVAMRIYRQHGHNAPTMVRHGRRFVISWKMWKSTKLSSSFWWCCLCCHSSLTTIYRMYVPLTQILHALLCSMFMCSYSNEFGWMFCYCRSIRCPWCRIFTDHDLN